MRKKNDELKIKFADQMLSFVRRFAKASMLVFEPDVELSKEQQVDTINKYLKKCHEFSLEAILLDAAASGKFEDLIASADEHSKACSE